MTLTDAQIRDLAREHARRKEWPALGEIEMLIAFLRLVREKEGA
jgi:hypothetical protein